MHPGHTHFYFFFVVSLKFSTGEIMRRQDIDKTCFACSLVYPDDPILKKCAC